MRLLLPTLLLACAFTAVAQQPATTAELATALLAAKTEAEQTAWLTAHPALVNAELCRVLLARGDTQLKQRQFELARAAFQLALTAAQRCQDQAAQANALSKLGAAAYQAGRFPAAAEFQQQSLPLFRALGDQLGEAEALRNLGTTQRVLGQYAEALANFRQALALAEGLNDNLQLARTLNSLSILSRLMGQSEQSLDYAKEALARFERGGDQQSSAAMYLSLGNTYGELGDAGAALTAYQTGLRLSEALQDRPRVSSYLSQIGLLHHKQGDYGAAQAAYERSLALDRELKDEASITTLYSKLGSLHLAQSNYARALEYNFDALERFRQSGQRPGVAIVLNNIGEVLFEQGKYDEASNYLQQALQLSQELKRADIEAMVVQKFAHMHRFAGRREEAHAAYQRAVALNEGRQEGPGLAVALGNLAAFHSYAGEHREAVAAAERTLALAAKLGSAEIEWQMRTVLGRAQRASNQPEQARRAFDEAIQIVETMRANADPAAPGQAHFLDNKLAAHEEQISLLVAERQPAAALQYAERAKARALVDVLQQGRAALDGALTDAERADEQRLQQAMNTRNAQLLRARGQAKPDEARLAELSAQLQQARRAYEEFQTRLFTAHPELRLQRGQAPLFELADAAALLPDARTALLEFAFTRTQLFLFVITRAPQLKLDVFELPLTRAELNDRVEELHRLLATRNLDFRTAAARLYDDLLRPAQGVLQDKTQLVIVPEERLWELPFHALHDGRQYLLERAAVSYAPSLTVLGAMQKLRRPRANAAPTLLAFGNPAQPGDAPGKQSALPGWRAAMLAPLPQAETEVNALARLYGARHSRVYLGAAAREDVFKAEASGYDVLHLAAHGVLNDTRPLYSQIVLSANGVEDGLLEAWELLRLRLHPDLVVLSACETARGHVVAGEGVIGLSWALFVAGAPAVVVSQWKVDADATTSLMVGFHRHLRRGAAVTKAEALRQAALTLLRGGHRHPFYWAGFVAVGAVN